MYLLIPQEDLDDVQEFSSQVIIRSFKDPQGKLGSMVHRVDKSNNLEIHIIGYTYDNKIYDVQIMINDVLGRIISKNSYNMYKDSIDSLLQKISLFEILQKGDDKLITYNPDVKVSKLKKDVKVSKLKKDVKVKQKPTNKIIYKLKRDVKVSKLKKGVKV
jgi:hypothetical protein